jgi:hypothetical protein
MLDDIIVTAAVAGGHFGADDCGGVQATEAAGRLVVHCARRDCVAPDSDRSRGKSDDREMSNRHRR